MSREPFDESLLTAYLDEELSQEDRKMVESALRESPHLTKLLEELRIVRNLVSNAVRGDENRLAVGDTTSDQDVSQAPFTIRGPWQSVSETQPNGRATLTIRPQKAENVDASNVEHAFRPSLRSWMMLASLAATVLLGLFVFSPWRSVRDVPIAAAPALKTRSETADSANVSSSESRASPRHDAALAASEPRNAETMPSASLPQSPTDAVPLGMTSPSEASASRFQEPGSNSSSVDAPLPNRLANASNALINLLVDATSLSGPNRAGIDTMAHNRKLQGAEKLEVAQGAKQNVEQSTALDKSPSSINANALETSDSKRSQEQSHFVFVLGSQSDAIGSIDKTETIDLLRRESGVPLDAQTAGLGGAGSSGSSKPNAAGPGFGGGGFGGGRADVPSLGPSQGTWLLAALDRPEPRKGLSSEIIIEFRFPKNREDQAIEALRELGVIFPVEQLPADAAKDWFISEFVDSQQELNERIEYRIAEREKADVVESEASADRQRMKRYLEPIPDQWRSIRIMLRKGKSETE